MADKSFLPFLVLSSAIITGTKYANVFPEPFCDYTTKFLSIFNRDIYYTFEGLLYP